MGDVWCSYGDRSRILAARARRVLQEAATGHKSPQKVTLMRQYRRGELPDILQVTLDSLLKPLGKHMHFSTKFLEFAYLHGHRD